MGEDYQHTAVVMSLFDTGLGVIRSLGRLGIPVLGLDCNPILPGFKSRYCKAKMSPDPVRQPEALLEFLLKEAAGLEKPGIILPTSDAYVLFLSRYREELCKHYLFNLPSETVLEAMVNKRCQYELAEKIGTPIAKTFYPETMQDVHAIKKKLDYPALIKPYVGHLWREKFGSTHKGFKVFSPDELVARYEEIFPTGLEAMVQSIIQGPNTNHFKVNMYIGVQGNVLATFTLRKIHQYPTEFGVGSCVESMALPDLVKLGMQFFRGINYRGVGSIEFKRDDRDGQLKMIELNPRFWQQNILATDCGMNFALVEYLDLIGKPQKPLTQFEEGRKWLDPVLDLPSFWDYHRRHETNMIEWLRSWKGVASFPVFAWDDLGPFLLKYEYGRKFFAAPSYIFGFRK